MEVVRPELNMNMEELPIREFSKLETLIATIVTSNPKAHRELWLLI